MLQKKKLCQNWKLYLITDRPSLGSKDLGRTVAEAIAGGAGVVQLRDKAADRPRMIAAAIELLKITRAAGVPLIINDSIAVAKASGADGVHLGQEDASLAEARAALGGEAIIGRSTHSPEQIRAAIAEGFDYIGVGPVYATPTKPTYVPVGIELVRYAAANATIPFVAIGGINATNVREVRAAGAKTIAAVRAVMGADDPRLAAAELL